MFISGQPVYATPDPYATAFMGYGTAPVNPYGAAAVDPYAAVQATNYGPVAAQAGWASPAAGVPTAYLQAAPPQASMPVQGPSLLDAIANAILGAAPQPQQQMVAPQAVAAGATQIYTADVAQPVRQAAASVERVAATYAAGASAVVGKASRAARRKGKLLWAGVRDPRRVHVTQVPSKFNPKPTAGNRDCGPASVLMALKLVGAKIPGLVAGAAPQRQIDHIRRLASNTASTMSTTNWELEQALSRAGAGAREIFDLQSITDAIRNGKPVILNGNPRNEGAYGWRFGAGKMQPFNGSHWMVVSGLDESTGKFIVNDPLSKVGPVQVSPSELEAYRGGSLGIEVTAA